MKSKIFLIITLLTSFASYASDSDSLHPLRSDSDSTSDRDDLRNLRTEYLRSTPPSRTPPGSLAYKYKCEQPSKEFVQNLEAVVYHFAKSSCKPFSDPYEAKVLSKDLFRAIAATAATQLRLMQSAEDLPFYQITTAKTIELLTAASRKARSAEERRSGKLAGKFLAELEAADVTHLFDSDDSW